MSPINPFPTTEPKIEHYTGRIGTLNILRDESIGRRLDCHTFVTVLDGDIMHIVVVPRNIKSVRLPDMVRNDLVPGSEKSVEKGYKVETFMSCATLLFPMIVT